MPEFYIAAYVLKPFHAGLEALFYGGRISAVTFSNTL
jgi:hypothetical protein